jgi:hypothetical protein
MNQNPKQESDVVTLPLQHVTIYHRGDTLTGVFPADEVEVLKAVHGPDKVRVSDEAADEGEFNLSADGEYARLQRKYRAINAPDPVRIAFSGGARDLERYGFKLGRAMNVEAPRSGIRDHRAKKAA